MPPSTTPTPRQHYFITILLLLVSTLFVSALPHSKRAPSENVVNQALVLSKVGDSAPATSILDLYQVPYYVLEVPLTGISTLNFELSTGQGNYSMVVMTSSLYDNIPTAGFWSLLTDTQIAYLQNYLTKYSTRLVKLGDFPIPSTGVSPAPESANQDLVVSPSAVPLILSAGVSYTPGQTWKTTGLNSYPGFITNTTLATPIMFFKPTSTQLNQTVAAALLNLPTTPSDLSKTYEQLSFYLPLPTWSPVSADLGRVWLSWVSKGVYPASVQPLSTFKIENKALVIAKTTDDTKAATLILETYSHPYTLFFIDRSDPLVMETVEGSGMYTSLIQVVQESQVPPSIRGQLEAYATKFRARVVKLNDVPSVSTGTIHALTEKGDGGDRNVYIHPQSLKLFLDTGIQPTILLPTRGLHKYPALITNSTLSTPVLMFEPGDAYTTPTIAAVLLKTPSGFSQLSFFLPSGYWNPTSILLSHMWFNWCTRGTYAGQRRILFSTQIDDVFLSTTEHMTSNEFRISNLDVMEHLKWQKSLNGRMNPGSRYRMELVINGNGVFNYVNSKNASVGYVDLIDEAYADVDKEFKKPSGTGVDAWANVNVNTFSAAQVALNLPTFLKTDPLFEFLYTNADEFFFGSHTFTHEDLNNCTYRDVYNEISINQNFARGAEMEGKSFWSSHAMVTPGISGVFSSDALQALRDRSITSVVGDTTRTNINNAENRHWPFFTTTASSGFSGYTIIPRFATAIYFNCTTPQQNENLYSKIYPSNPLPMAGILQNEVDRV
ncbi:hypothetical protein HDV05_008050, partial [Chytridiales sp. JEL 0842]